MLSWRLSGLTNWLMIETDSTNFRSSICSQFEVFCVRFCLWCGRLQCSVWSVFLLYKHLQVLISGRRRHLMLVSQWFPQWKDIKTDEERLCRNVDIPNASTGMDDRICSNWEEGSGLLIQEKGCNGKHVLPYFYFPIFPSLYRIPRSRSLSNDLPRQRSNSYHYFHIPQYLTHPYHHSWCNLPQVNEAESGRSPL